MRQRYWRCLAAVLAGLSLGSLGLTGPGLAETRTTETQLTFVYGKDERRPFNTSEAELDLARKVGGVVGGKGLDAEVCTGVLVGRDLVAFAAHCIYDGETKKPRVPLASLRYFPYLPHLREEIPIKSAKALWVGGKAADWARGEDWALMRLARPPQADLGYMQVIRFAGKPTRTVGSKDKSLSGKVSLIAFHYDLNAAVGPMISPNCNVYDVHEQHPLYTPDLKIFFHDCDAAPGSSGGAFVTRTKKGRWALVGLESGVYGDLDTFRSGDAFDYRKAVSLAAGSAAFYERLQGLLK